MAQYEYTSFERNRAICRKDLDTFRNGDYLLTELEECRDMQFFKVAGVTRFQESESLDIHSLAGDILSSCVVHGVPFAYVLIGNKQGISVYIGTIGVVLEGLRSSFEALYPGIDIREEKGNPLDSCACEYGGLFTGIPTDKLDSEKKSLQVDNICTGMLGKNFTYVILAKGVSNIAVTLGHQRLLEEMTVAYPRINQTVSGGALGNVSAQTTNFNNKNYYENLEKLEEFMNIGISKGMWRVNGYYASDRLMDSKKLGNIIKASFLGDESSPEPFRILEYNSIKHVISNTYMVSDRMNNCEMHPVGQWYNQGSGRQDSLFVYKFQTLLNSDQLGTLCRLPMKEFPGYYVDDYVEFDVACRTQLLEKPIQIGEIVRAGRGQRDMVDNPYRIAKKDLNRHALIVGITGGGKTNTSKSLINTLWNSEDPLEKLPFLVVESAKREYWQLRNQKGFEDLLVFTLGAESKKTSVKYRINPFETNPGISLQTHIDYLLATFKASFDLFPPLPYILEKAVYEIYSDRGWDIVENHNRYGLKEYPTLTNLYNKIDVLIDRMGYHSEVQSNVKAALQARVNSLMIGGKGAMLNTPKSVPIKELLNRPVVLELEDLGDDETKSFVIGLLLVQLYEYRKTCTEEKGDDLSHILLIEEAHRLLKSVEGTGEEDKTRANSVEFFCNLLAEIRAYGQGIFIADQIPTKLASDTIKNTNLKIVHRTVASDDRETMGRAMNMTPSQIEYLSSLKRGYAAVYSEEDNKPKCVKMPLVKPCYNKSRNEVIDEARDKAQEISQGYDKVIKNHIACSYCEERCEHSERIVTFLKEKIVVEEVQKKWKEVQYQAKSLESFLKSVASRGLFLESNFAQICCLGYILEQDDSLNDGRKSEIIAEYLRYIY